MKSNREFKLLSIGHIIYDDRSNMANKNIIELSGEFKGQTFLSGQELKQELISSYPDKISQNDRIIHFICVGNRFHLQIERTKDNFSFFQYPVGINQITKKKDNTDYQTQDSSFFKIFNILKRVCLPEQIEEWMGDIHELIESETKDNNYPQWRIRLMYTQEILILIYSAIKVKVSAYLCSWLEKLSI